MRKVRAGAWVVLLALAGAQAWSARFYATPDGVSYMDLSDAVLNGQWSELLNAYWSPLYPALIGVLRALFHPTAYWEFAIPHLLNIFCFAACLAGYEYFIAPLRRLGRSQWNKPGLDTTWGMVGAYAIFGAFTLMMTPLTLPTPDLLVSASAVFAFGALLRLRYESGSGRAAVVLGLALAAGSLAKSFVIPWAGVCILTAFAAVRGTTRRPAIVATAVWLVAVVPWTAGLSARSGHPTFGDSGRLTYVWYVNRLETPSAKFMPSAAATPATDSIQQGIAITPNAPGTNPVWYDPARWYGDLRPEFVLTRQLEVFGILVAEYIASLAPFFLVISFWLIAAGPHATMEWWKRSWPVVVPALAALAAYSIVLVTTRYVAPFYMALTVMVLCAAPWPERIPATRMLVAIGVPLILMVATPNPGVPMALINAAVGSVLFAWILRYRSPVLQAAFAVVGGLSIRALEPRSDLRYVTAMSVLLILAYWAMARDSANRGEEELTSTLVRRGLIGANAVLVIFVATLKYGDSMKLDRFDPQEPNNGWYVARLAQRAGITPGAKIALVGSPFDAYWMRVLRAQAVAVVPPPWIPQFNQLPADRRRRLFEEFRKAGAEFVVVQQNNAPPEADRSWGAMPLVGWVGKLR